MKTVVLYPGLGVGHLIPMIELADVFLKHGYAVIVVLIEPPIKVSTFAVTADRVASSNPSISFHVLPPIPLPSVGSDRHTFLLMFDLLHQYNEHLLSFLRCRPPVDALIIDMFSVAALDVAAQLRIPVYTFFSSGAAVLAVYLQLPSLCANTKTSLKELGETPLSFPGVPPMPASHLVKEMLDRDSELFKVMINVCERIPAANGILVNTFESLESRAVRTLKDALCVPGRVLPPVYCIGPLVAKGEELERAEKHECLAWLDAQPERSIVFLCFGSMGSLPVEQLKELAVGLEKSRHRFLWVVRTPHSDDSKKFFDPRPEPDVEALVPEGFLERTKDRGLVVKSWAPQVEVLRHKATGAFVTHCGWNSTLEGITAGLPLLCWPLGAEQKMNKVFMVEEMKVGVELKGYHEGSVKAEEVEAKIRLVMESEEGKELRERVAAHKDGAAEALKDGGPSRAAFAEFLSDLEKLGRELRA